MYTGRLDEEGRVGTHERVFDGTWSGRGIFLDGWLLCYECSAFFGDGSLDLGSGILGEVVGCVRMDGEVVAFYPFIFGMRGF